MAEIQYKVFQSEIKESNETDLTITHFISTEEKDRGGDIMRADGMKIKGKPVVLLQHGRDGRVGREPIAKPLSIGPGMHNGTKGILAKTQYFPDETGKRLWKKAVDGYMPNFSIGYITIKAVDLDNYSGRDVLEWELLEYSQVGVPMNSGATTLDVMAELQFKIMPEEDQQEEKTVIPYKKTPLAPENESWDGPKEISAADVKALKIMCVWFDDRAPDNKGSYKGPHHKAAGDHACVWNGVRALAGVIMGARTKISIPGSDMPGVKNHVAKHYEDFDKGKPPWESNSGKAFLELSKAFNQDEIDILARKLFPELAEFFTSEQKEISESEQQENTEISELSKPVESTEPTIADLIKKIDALENKISSTLPASPDAEIKNGGDQDNNPPDHQQKVIPRLVIVDTEKQQKELAGLIGNAAINALNHKFKSEIDKMKGKVS